MKRSVESFISPFHMKATTYNDAEAHGIFILK